MTALQVQVASGRGPCTCNRARRVPRGNLNERPKGRFSTPGEAPCRLGGRIVLYADARICHWPTALTNALYPCQCTVALLKASSCNLHVPVRPFLIWTVLYGTNDLALSGWVYASTAWHHVVIAFNCESWTVVSSSTRLAAAMRREPQPSEQPEALSAERLPPCQLQFRPSCLLL